MTYEEFHKKYIVQKMLKIPKQQWNILYYLANRETMHRDQLITALWSDDEPQNPLNQISIQIHRLRRALARFSITINKGPHFSPYYMTKSNKESLHALISYIEKTETLPERWPLEATSQLASSWDDGTG